MEKDQLEIILEPIDSKFQLLLEGMALVDKKLTENADLSAFENQVLDEKIDAIKDCLKAPENKLINLCSCRWPRSARQYRHECCEGRLSDWV